LWLPAIIVVLLLAKSASKVRVFALLLGAALLVGPVTLRNWIVERDVVLISANAGLNFYIGNNPRANGAYNLPEGLWFKPGDPGDDFAGFAAAKESLGYRPSSSELSRWWFDKAWRHIQDAPLATVERVVQKVYLWFNTTEQPQLYDYRGYQYVASILGVLPLAGVLLVGIGLALLLWIVGWFDKSSSAKQANNAKPSPARLAYGVCVATYGLAYVPFFVVGRYRAPWLAFAAPLAAWAMVAFYERLKAGSWQLRAVLALGFLLCLSVIAVPKRMPAPVSQLVAFGRTAEKTGAPRRAESWYRKALALDSAHWAAGIAALRWSRLRLEARDVAAACKLASDGLRHHPRSAGLKRALGRCHLAQNRLPRACELLRQSLALAPAEVVTWVALASCEQRRGNLARARRACKSAGLLARSAADKTRVGNACASLQH
jgi:tetratricopeptide (TPR) repeat protein